MLCSYCGSRHAQYLGLCRACGRAFGVYALNTKQQEAEHLARQVAKRPPTVDLRPRPSIHRVINGEEFEVVWDGA